MLGNPINVAGNNLADEGDSMRKKRLFAFSLIIALSALFITPQIVPARIASAQNAKLKQDGFITGCSDSVIDALDKCIQERFSKADMLFGFGRVTPPTLHANYLEAKTESEREAISDLEKDGWQVAFYLVGRSVLGPTPDLKILTHQFPGLTNPIINGPIAITPSTIFDDRERARDYRAGPTVNFPSLVSERRKMIEQLKLPEPLNIWDDARKAMLEFEKRDQYDFSFRKWNIAARPIRAKEACLKCHTGDGPTAPGLTPPKVGDALGVAMYAYARKQKGASTLVR